MVGVGVARSAREAPHTPAGRANAPPVDAADAGRLVTPLCAIPRTPMAAAAMPIDAPATAPTPGDWLWAPTPDDGADGDGPRAKRARPGRDAAGALLEALSLVPVDPGLAGLHSVAGWPRLSVPFEWEGGGGVAGGDRPRPLLPAGGAHPAAADAPPWLRAALWPDGEEAGDGPPLVRTPLPEARLVVGWQGDWIETPASVLPLWDASPLSPAGPAKGAQYAVVVPERLSGQAAALMVAVSEVWASSSLGTHAPTGHAPRGIVPYGPDSSAAAACAGLLRRLAAARARTRPPPGPALDGDPAGGLLIYVVPEADGLDGTLTVLVACARAGAGPAAPGARAPRAPLAALAPLPPALLADARPGTARALAFAGYARLAPAPAPAPGPGRRARAPLAADAAVALAPGAPSTLHCAYAPLPDGSAAVAWTDAAGELARARRLLPPAGGVAGLPAALLAACARLRSAAAAASTRGETLPRIVIVRAGDPGEGEEGAWRELLSRRVVGGDAVLALAASLDAPHRLTSPGDTVQGPFIVRGGAGGACAVVVPPPARGAAPAAGEADAARTLTLRWLAGAGPDGALHDSASHMETAAGDLHRLAALSLAREAASLAGRGWASPSAHAPPHMGAAVRLARLWSRVE